MVAQSFRFANQSRKRESLIHSLNFKEKVSELITDFF